MLNWIIILVGGVTDNTLNIVARASCFGYRHRLENSAVVRRYCNRIQ